MKRIGCGIGKMSKVSTAALAAVLLMVLMMTHPASSMAQATGTGSIHGHVTNPAGMALTKGEVRLSTDRTSDSKDRKYQYKFPIDPNGDYTGTGIAPGNYVVFVFQDDKSLDFNDSVVFANGDDKLVNFDMSRQEYLSKMSPEDRKALEEYKKKNAEVVASNAKIQNLNALLTSARAATKALDFDTAVKNMQDATAAKPDEAILWDTLGDAQLGQANVAAKAAKDAKTTDPSVSDKYGAAITSYQKAITLNAAAAKPSPDLTAAAENQLGQAFGKLGKNTDSAAAYDAAAKADPPKAATYYYNEAATLFNANDMPNAAIAADKAIAADPTKVDAYYIKGQALIQNATVDPKTNVITAPPDCIAAYQKYLQLAPTGPHAEEIKGILAGIGVKIETNYKAPKK